MAGIVPTGMVVTGIGVAHLGAGQRDSGVEPWLKNRKTRKFMGKQDELATAAAGRALQQAGLLGTPALTAAGVYLSVGHIPFERADIEAIARHSTAADGGFDMRAFATDGIEQVNPLLTFRCLPNMPAFHVSLNFAIQGPSFVSYPGIAQAYQALAQAVADLEDGQVTHALVGGVADQHNFLVDFFFDRVPERQALQRTDAAGLFCLEPAAQARDRGAPVLARLVELQCGAATGAADRPPASGQAEAHPAALACWLAGRMGQAGPAEHRARSLEGFAMGSRWEIA